MKSSHSHRGRFGMIPSSSSLNLIQRCFIALVISLSILPDAQVQAARETTRIGILHSALSEAYYGEAFVYRQLYTAVQSQAIQAGVPFDLLTENDLGDLDKLSGYRAIVIPSLQTVASGNVAQYSDNLRKLLWENGVSLIASDAFFSYNESRQYQGAQTSAAMNDIFGLSFGSFGTFSNVIVSATGSSHPIADLIQSRQNLAEYSSIFYQEFLPSAGNTSSPVAWFTHGNTTRPAIQAGIRGNGKMVHFADIEKMVDSKILWAAIQWAVSDNASPASNIELGITRQKGLFMPRNDMDLSRFLSAVRTVHFPLLDILERWKTDYGFKGSFYINIGNNPQTGVYTDWDLSGPLYRDYIAIGNEIGTHSYTHPQDTKQLTQPELEFEFLNSRNEIAAELGFPVLGTGIPGEDENLFVYDNIKSYFDYISGHTLYSGSKHIQSFGVGMLTPSEDTVYFSLNMTPDFVLGDILQLSPAESSAAWQTELENQSVNMRRPMLHWLWHDYGIINPNGSPYYGLQAFDEIVARAHAEQLEFVTMEEYSRRFRSFMNSDVLIDYLSENLIEVEVTGSGLGGLTIDLPESEVIASAGSHYAYDGNRLFLPANGGVFQISTGTASDDVTRIKGLSSGLELQSVTGDGSALAFEVNGQGTIQIDFRDGIKYQVFANGGSVEYLADGANVTFVASGVYSVQVQTTDNLPPVADDISVVTAQATPVTITLPAMDFDGTLFNMVIVSGPVNGSATIDNLVVTYTPDPGFNGIETIVYEVTDNQGLTDRGTVTVTVTARNLSDGNPSYNLMSQNVSIDGALTEWAGLEKMADDPVEFSASGDLLDYTGLYLAHNSTKFFMFYTSAQQAPLNWAHNAFIDTDGLKQTGFILGGIGADILVQGGFAYKYTGTGLDWSWQQLFNIIISQDGGNVELCLDRSLFPNTTSLRLILLGDNSAYTGGSGLDLFPENVFSSTNGYFSYEFFSETTNSVPVAQSASYSMNEGEQLTFTLSGFDMDGDPLTYNVTGNPSNGQISGSAPNLTYTPASGFSGSDSLTFTVTDGKAASQSATVSITVNQLPVDPDKMSNAVSTPILVDGNLSDWNSLVPFPADPADQTAPENLLDWIRIRMAHDNQNLYIAVSNKSAIQFNWAYNLYLDTDLNSNTGFQASYAFTGVGAEYLIQSDLVYRYTGTGGNWSWEFLGSAQSAINGSNVEMAMPRALIGNPSEINFVAYGDNAAYPGGSGPDLYPDGAQAGEFHNYFFGIVPAPTSIVRTAETLNSTPVPPLVPHTLRIRYMSPDAINPGSTGSSQSAGNYTDIRMTARPNTTWKLIHSNDLVEWNKVRNWDILGSFSEFVFPLDESNNPKGQGIHGFFEALQDVAPKAGTN